MSKTKTVTPPENKITSLNERLQKLIPGGAHTYAKGIDQFPEFHAPVMKKGEGCIAWDCEGNSYIEYGMGLRSVTLGHAYPPVIEAAYKAMKDGTNFTRPSILELEAAELFLSIVPGAEMVKFGKNGSDATTAALKLARAYTGRNMVAICADHPFFSIDDWFIGHTKINAGIPMPVRDLTVSFRYNDLQSLEHLFDKYPQQISCIFLEPEKYEPPKDGFLHKAKELCHKNGALFILDEMITGFRWHLGGAQTLYNVTPDLSTFGKAMGNGFAISALCGKKEFMQLGGLQHDRERVFLLSTTHGAETHALAAFKAVVVAYQKNDVIQHLMTHGDQLRNGLEAAIARNNLTDFISIPGPPCCLVCSTADHNGAGSQPYRTLLLQEIMKRGVIAPNLVISFAHQKKHINQTISAFEEAFSIYRKALDSGIENFLNGKSVQPVYRKYNA